MSISIVIPSYNGIELVKNNLQKVLEALGEYTTDSKQLIIVDDNSTDGSFEYLEIFKKVNSEKSIEINIFQNTKNMGFSSTVNKGVASASGEIIVLLNSDVRPQANFLQPLLSHFDDSEVFAVGCMDESVEGDSIVKRGRGIGRWQKGLLQHSAGKIERQGTLWVSGGSGAFRKSIWDKLGGLEELYSPFYWEDIDLSYRAIKSGYKILFDNKSIVVHEHEKGAIKKNFGSTTIKKISYRNQLFFVWLNITDYKLLISHIFWMPYHIMTTLLSRDCLFIFGLFLAIKKLPKIAKERSQRKKMFVLSDKKILLPFSAEFTK